MPAAEEAPAPAADPPAQLQQPTVTAAAEQQLIITDEAAAAEQRTETAAAEQQSAEEAAEDDEEHEPSPRLRERLARMVGRIASFQMEPLFTGLRRSTPAAAPTGAEVHCIACARCNAPIGTAEELLPEQITRLESASYPYQLDLLGEEECWVYSATNPNATRFDVARFGGAACKRVRTYGERSGEHSFFPPHRWQMADCGTCQAHVGWVFSPPPTEGSTTPPPPAFVGLVLTHLRERVCRESELETSIQKCSAPRRHPPPPASPVNASAERDPRTIDDLIRDNNTAVVRDGLDPAIANQFDVIARSVQDLTQQMASMPPEEARAMRQRITRALHAAAEFAENMAGGDGDGEEEAAATPADEPEPAAFTIPEVPTHGTLDNGTNFVQMPGTGSIILEGPLPPQLEELIARRAAEQEQEAAAVSDLLEEEEEETAADTDLGAVDGMP